MTKRVSDVPVFVGVRDESLPSAIGSVATTRLGVDGIGPGQYLAALGAAKAADAITTVVGLSIGGSIVESNPALRMLIDQFGLVPAVLVGSLFVVLLVGVVTEAAARFCRRNGEASPWSPTALRVIGYVPISVIFFAAATNNLYLIATSMGVVP